MKGHRTPCDRSLLGHLSATASPHANARGQPRTAPKEFIPAMELEAYAKQAKNVDAERKACEIKLRAERKAGDLLAQMQRATKVQAGQLGGRGNTKESSRNDGASFSEYRQAIQDAGIAPRTADRYQTLARVPDAEFEQAMRRLTL